MSSHWSEAGTIIVVSAAAVTCVGDVAYFLPTSSLIGFPSSSELTYLC